MTDIGGKRVFLSYSRAQQRVVAEVAAKLRKDGCEVFFDRASLKGENFDDRIRAEVEHCDVFVVFISLDSMRKGGYVRTELGYAEALWPDPAEHVLAIRCDEVSDEQVPAYLSSNLNLITLDGNFATEARNMVLARLAQPARMPDLALGNLDELPVAECVSRLVSALSRRRKLPPTGTATVEAQHEIDALAIIIKRRFKPDEGSTVAGARLVKVIGVGNFGTVWEAVDQESGQPVAVKIFRLERLNEGQMLGHCRTSSN